MKMKTITIKANNTIINDYFKDYKGCVIEMEKENIPLIRSKDNFEIPKGGGKKIFYYVRIKGYQSIFNVDLYKSEYMENCVKYVNQFFELLQNAKDFDFLNLDELIKI